jgi:hypothetical protein
VYPSIGSSIPISTSFASTSERFDRAIELSREAGEVLTTPLLAGLELPLARIFRD